MPQKTSYDFALLASREHSEIRTLEDVTAILEYADRREAGWPCSTVTGMFVGRRRLQYPIAAALIDHKLSTGMEPGEAKVRLIYATIQAEQRARRENVEAWQAEEKRRAAAAEIDAGRHAIRLGLFS